jgi:DNA end-binding protein Ku
VPADEVNPLMYDSSYLVLPDRNAKPYALLAEAMADSGRVGVGRFVMRQKEYLAAIRSDGKHLTLSTLVFPDELVEPASLDEFEQLDGVKVSSKELAMAKGLVEALSDDFEPDQYTDEYRVAVEQIIEQKAAGVTPTFEEAPKERATVIDLAAALEASLAEARQAKGRHPSGKNDEATASKPAKRAAPRRGKKAQPELEEADEPAAAKPRARARKSA